MRKTIFTLDDKPEPPDLNALFDEYNEKHFRGMITKIPVIWSDSLRTCAGRCHIIKIGGFWKMKPTRIEISSKVHGDMDYDLNELRNTMIHEMAHAYLSEHFGDNTHGTRFQNTMDSIIGYKKSHTYHSYDVQKNQRRHKVEIICPSCGVIGHKTNMPSEGSRKYHRVCGQTVSFRRIKVNAI